MINPNDEGPEPLVSISVSEYQELKSDSRMLAALLAAGVDNWEGYDFARELWEEQSK